MNKKVPLINDNGEVYILTISCLQKLSSVNFQNTKFYFPLLLCEYEIKKCSKSKSTQLGTMDHHQLYKYFKHPQDYVNVSDSRATIVLIDIIGSRKISEILGHEFKLNHIKDRIDNYSLFLADHNFIKVKNTGDGALFMCHGASKKNHLKVYSIIENLSLKSYNDQKKLQDISPLIDDSIGNLRIIITSGKIISSHRYSDNYFDIDGEIIEKVFLLEKMTDHKSFICDLNFRDNLRIELQKGVGQYQIISTKIEDIKSDYVGFKFNLPFYKILKRSEELIAQYK